MNKEILEKSFNKMGAKVIFDVPASRFNNPEFDLDVVTSKKSKESYFRLDVINDSIISQLTVLDIDPKDRHLLLMRKESIYNRKGDPIDYSKWRYLVGHDERDWFVAGVPDDAMVSTVQQAKDALRPLAALNSIKSKGKMKNRNKRKNKGFLRQGEWFCIPVDIDLSEEIIHKNEPITRGRAKPHIVSEIVRRGGRTVNVHRLYPEGVDEKEKASLIKGGVTMGWRTMLVDAKVYGRGFLRHPDHATVKLPGWHEIVPNTESRASQMGTLTFLD